MFALRGSDFSGLISGVRDDATSLSSIVKGAATRASFSAGVHSQNGFQENRGRANLPVIRLPGVSGKADLFEQAILRRLGLAAKFRYSKSGRRERVNSRAHFRRQASMAA